MEKQAKTLRLILSDQLNSKYSWFYNDQDDYVLMEIFQETDYVVHQVQKTQQF